MKTKQNSKLNGTLIALAAAAALALLPTTVMADDTSVSLGSEGYKSTTHTDDRDRNNYNSTYDRDRDDYYSKHHGKSKHHHKSKDHDKLNDNGHNGNNGRGYNGNNGHHDHDDHDDHH
ncbi:MAG TPA: hypothetical protein VKR58_04465 [Aquella sp.]|nr:hypothetical protein [Aquella sp.]